RKATSFYLVGPCDRRDGGRCGAEVLLVLAQEKLVGHARDIVAHNHMTGSLPYHLLVRYRHGVGSLQIVHEKFFQTANRPLAVFGDQRVIVNMCEKKIL